MKTLPAGMQADLNNGATTHCHCWRLIRSDGSPLGFTDHDNDLTFGGLTFEAASGFTASAIESSTSLNVDNMDVQGALISGRLDEDDLSAGLWDNAEITVFRVDWTNVEKRIILLKGSIGEVSRGNINFTAEVRSMAHELNQPGGRMYTLQCDADLFDSRCKVNPSGYSNTGTVLTTNSARAFTTTDSGVLTRASGFFNRGRLIWTSGNNNGYSMEVKVHTKRTSDAAVTLWELMPYDIEVGDTFLIRAGCDKSIETCKAKFDNVINHRGFPRIPGNEAIQFYARKDGNNNGGSLWD